MANNNISEEEMMTPVIKDIEKLTRKVIRGIGGVFKSILGGLNSTLNLIITNFTLLIIVTIVAAAIGFFSTHIVPRQYASQIQLTQNINATQQLYNDVEYLEALIQKSEYEKLAAFFNISNQDAESITKCEIEPNSSYTEKLEAINYLYHDIDSSIRNIIDVELLMTENNPDIGNKFSISIHATDQSLFSKLEQPLMIYLERVNELQKQLETKRKTKLFEKAIFEKEMESLDTLMKVINKSMLEQSKLANSGGSDTYVMMGAKEDNRKNNDPLEIQNRYINYGKEISTLNNQITLLNSCYVVNAHLNNFGKKVGFGRFSRAAIFSAGALILTLLILFLRRNVKK